MLHASNHSSLRLRAAKAISKVHRITEELCNLGDLFLFSDSVESLLSVLSSDTENLLAVLGGEVHIAVELSLEVVSEELQVVAVFLSHVSDGDARSVLLADTLAQSSLALNDAERCVSGSAELWQPADQLNWIAVGSDDDQLGLSVFN